MQKKTFDVAVIGGGLCGLRTAQLLAAQDKSVALFEAAAEPGGVMKSVKTPNNAVVEEYYHHIFPSDKLTLNAIAGFGLNAKLEWWNARSAFLVENNLYELSKATDLLRFKPLSKLERAVLAAFMLRIKLANPAKYDNVNAVEWIRSRAGESLYNKFFAPLLRSKFGDAAHKVSAAWFIERMKLRSKRGSKGERLGYLRGGFHKLVEAVKRNAEAHGTHLHYNSPLKKITHNPDGSFTVVAGTHSVNAKKVVSTIPPARLADAIELSDWFASRMKRIEYQGAICVTVGLKAPQLSDYYWTNVLSPRLEFGAIVEHTNLAPRPEYGETIVYLASYPDKSNPVWRAPSKEVFEKYFDGLQKAFPWLEKKEVNWWHVAREPNAGIVYAEGTHGLLPFDCKTPIPNLFAGGMFNAYPDRSIEQTLRTAEKLAKLAK